MEKQAYFQLAKKTELLDLALCNGGRRRDPIPATAAGKAEKARGIPWDQGTEGAAQDRDCFQLKEYAVCEQALAAKCGVQEMISGKEHKLSF